MLCATTRPACVTTDEQLGLSTPDALSQDPGQRTTPRGGPPPPERTVPDLSGQCPASDLRVLDGRHNTMWQANRPPTRCTAELRLDVTPPARTGIHTYRLVSKLTFGKYLTRLIRDARIGGARCLTEDCPRSLWTVVGMGSGFPGAGQGRDQSKGCRGRGRQSWWVRAAELVWRGWCVAGTEARVP